MTDTVEQVVRMPNPDSETFPQLCVDIAMARIMTVLTADSPKPSLLKERIDEVILRLERMGIPKDQPDEPVPTHPTRTFGAFNDSYRSAAGANGMDWLFD